MSWNTSIGTGVDYNLIVTDVTSNTQALNIRLPGNTYTTALMAGHQYNWQVAACNATGCSSYTASQYFQTPGTTPSTPTGTATSGVSAALSGPGPVTPSSTVNLSWNTSSGTGVDYSLIVTDITNNTQALNIRLPGNTYTWTFTAGHQYSWKVAACNTAGCSSYTASQYFQTPSSTPALSITTTSLPSATVGTGYAQGVAVSGGQTPYTWSVSSGLLPFGLNINSTTGAIYGTPSASGTFYFTVTAADSSSPQKTASQALSLTVSPGAVVGPTISSVSPNPVTGSNIRQTITINGTGFVNKPTLTLTWTGQPGYTVPTAQVTFVSSTQAQMSITTTTTPDNWTVKVTNPDGRVSNISSFTVR